MGWISKGYSSFSRINIYATIHPCTCSGRTSMGAPERTVCAQDGDTGATPLRSSLVTPAPRPRRGQCPKSPSSSSRVPNSVIHDRRQPWPPQHGAGLAWDTRDSPQRRAGVTTPGRNHPTEPGETGNPRAPYLPPVSTLVADDKRCHGFISTPRLYLWQSWVKNTA